MRAILEDLAAARSADVSVEGDDGEPVADDGDGAVLSRVGEALDKLMVTRS